VSGRAFVAIRIAPGLSLLALFVAGTASTRPTARQVEHF
jgi:hypothetical protein